MGPAVIHIPAASTLVPIPELARARWSLSGDGGGMNSCAVHEPRSTRVWLRGELVDNGYTDKALGALVRRGALAKPRYGAYVDGADWRAADDVARHEITARAVLKQADTDVVLSHVTAAVVWDLSFWDLSPQAVHVTRRDGRCGRAEAGVNQHRGVLLEGDVTTRRGMPVVSPTRLALETAGVVDLEHSLSFTNELLRRKLTTHEQLWERYESMARWPHSLNTEVMIRLSRSELESVGESRSWFMFYKQGLPSPEPQFKIRDEYDRVLARVDFAWPKYRLFAEFDGRMKYLRRRKEGQSIEDAVLAEKAREEMIRERTGWDCIRLVWADLYRPEHSALRIRRIMDRQRAA